MFFFYFSKLLNLIIVLFVLLIGWVIVKIIEKVVYKGFRKIKIDDKFFVGKKFLCYFLEKVISKVVYFIVLIIVFILFFNILYLILVVFLFVSMFFVIIVVILSVLKVGFILLLGWVVVFVLSFFVKKIGMKLNMSDKLCKWNLVFEGKDIY